MVKPSTYSKGGHPVISAVATVSPDVLNMLSDFFVYLNTKWNIEKEENVFYNQVSNVYQKILDSNCFSNEFGLLRNTFTKNKEDILRHVVYMKGLTAGKNLIKFDVTDSEKQESARIIIQSLSELRDWDTAIEYLNEIKDLRLANFKDLKNLLIDNFRYVAELKFKEGITKIFKNKLKPGEIKKVNKEVFEFKLKIEGKYDDYVAKQKKKLAILIVGAAVLAIIVIVGFILYNSNVQSDYKESSKLEKKRIEQIDNSISSLINEKKYTEALNMINTDLVWKETNMLASSDDESNTKDLQLNYKKKILDSILKDLKERNQLIMDEENYRYISQEMILNYNAIMKEFDESAKDDLFDQYTDKFSTIIEELNKKRNTYLEKLVLQIDTAINSNDVNKAYSLLSELYHNSEETMKSELLGLSSTSYKEYWKDKKEELSEKLN